MKKALVKVNLEFEFSDYQSDEKIMEYLENVELPSYYQENSFEIIKIYKEDK